MNNLDDGKNPPSNDNPVADTAPVKTEPDPAPKTHEAEAVKAPNAPSSRTTN